MHSIIVMVAINFLEGEMKIMCIHQRSAIPGIGIESMKWSKWFDHFDHFINSIPIPGIADLCQELILFCFVNRANGHMSEFLTHYGTSQKPAFFVDWNFTLESSLLLR